MTPLRSEPGEAAMGAPLAVVLTMLLALQTVSVDTVFPAIPKIVQGLRITSGEGQVTVSVYIFTFAVTQLIYGPLSDRFGRRPVVLLTMGIYLLGSGVAALAGNFETLVAGRFLQGLGAASGPSLARAIVRDIHGPERSGPALSYLMAAFGVIAVINPIAGGALTDLFGWPAVFVYCGVYGAVICVLAWWFLRETLNPGYRAAIRPSRIARNFATIGTDRRFVDVAVCNCAYYGGMFVWLAGGPFAMVKILGLSAATAGLYFGLAISGFMFGSALAGRAARRYRNRHIIAAGAILCSMASASLLLSASLGAVTTLSLAIPAFLYMFGLGGALPPSMAAAVGPFPQMAGAASSLLGFLQMAVGAAMVATTGYLFDGTFLPMAVLMSLLSAVGLVALVLRR